MGLLVFLSVLIVANLQASAATGKKAPTSFAGAMQILLSPSAQFHPAWCVSVKCESIIACRSALIRQNRLDNPGL
jgi:hypothetical protein